MNDNELLFVSLGGAGEFGMNLNLYGYGGKWLMVDCGMGFGDGVRPGIDIILPDPTYIAERKRDLVGLVITHAHEDHIGAIAHLWPRLRCPIYASRFAAALIISRFNEHGIAYAGYLHVVDIGSTLDLAPFSVEMVAMTHSTLEPSLLAIRTGAGLVIHTGDWKLDPNPVVGRITDEARLKALGEEGVLALIGDSTNAVVAGHSKSEGDLEKSLAEVFSRFDKRIAVTCFSSNVARLVSIQRAAAANDRQTGIVGRSLWRVEDAARGAGYLDQIPSFLTDEDINKVPDRHLVLICTGSQGEPRSALARISEGDHPRVDLTPGDAVVFSARAIPGNEKAITTMQSRLAKSGIEVVTPDEAFVHVSGHAAREELITLYQWLRPKAVIPTHGEYPHLVEHMHIAQACQVQHVLMPENGMMIRISPGGLDVIDHVQTGHIAVDGKRLIDLNAPALRARQKLSNEGVVVCTLVMDRKGRLLADAAVSAPGLLSEEENGQGLEDVEDAVMDAVEKMDSGALKADAMVRDAARLAIRRHCNSVYGKKPWIDIHIVRVE